MLTFGNTDWFFESERKMLNEKLVERKSRRQKKANVVEDNEELNIASRCVLTWENLTYDVPGMFFGGGRSTVCFGCDVNTK